MEGEGVGTRIGDGIFWIVQIFILGFSGVELF